MRYKIKYLLLELLLVCSLHVNGNDVKQGLYFRSFEVDKDKRTSLDLTPEKPLTLNKGFTIEFDIQIRRYTQNFGYIFRIIANDTLNIDFITNIASEESAFAIVVKNRSVIQYTNTELRYSLDDTWMKAIFIFDPENNIISLSLNGVKKDVSFFYDQMNKFHIYFGGNTHNIFSTTDVAPMTIKNINIFDATSNLVRNWKLGAHSNNTVYDECKFAEATVSNPQWEIDSHIQWSKQASLVLPGSKYCMTFDPVNDRIFITKRSNIFIYDVKRQAVDTIKVHRGVPYHTDFNHLVYDTIKNILISYSFYSGVPAIFNFNTLEWNNENTVSVPATNWHHSNYYIATDSLLVTFGGYGFHRYKSEFYKYSLADTAWRMSDISSSITPRYLGSMGYLDNELLYFGGFGSESGRQEEFPTNYYDLYSINVDDLTVKNIWKLPIPEEHFTNSNSMVIDKDNRKFYTLSYPNKRYASVIKLHEYSLDKPEYRVVGDTIPYYFNDIESYCSLFQSSDKSELYAIVSHTRRGETEINIYSIAFPPVNIEDIIQHLPSRSSLWIWLLIIVTGSLIVVVIIKKKTAFKKKSGIQANNDKEEPILYNSFFEEKNHSSINLLGNFHIVDTKGNDISKSFNQTTTQLFLLMLMSTIKNGQGITSHELRKILWFDKSDDSARNNRNVYINKLRSILKSFEEIKIVNNDGYWTIQYEKNVFCDYERAQKLMKRLQTIGNFNIKLFTELVDIALKGTLLPYIQTEWLELYQADYANHLIECLMEHCKHSEVKPDLMLLIKIADVILLHDNIDENAIKIKCYALFGLGRKNQALQTFNKFSADYENLLAAKHNLVFEELIKSI